MCTIWPVLDRVGFGELAREAAAFDVHMLPDGELLAAVAAVVEGRSWLDAALGHLLADVDVRGTTDDEFGLTTGVWFTRCAGVPPSSGRDRVRVARVLHDRLGEVDGALAEGRLSWDHARVLAAACNPRIAER